MFTRLRMSFLLPYDVITCLLCPITPEHASRVPSPRGPHRRCCDESTESRSRIRVIVVLGGDVCRNIRDCGNQMATNISRKVEKVDLELTLDSVSKAKFVD